MRPLVLYGASELARDMVSVIEALEADGRGREFLGFLDDGPDKQGIELMGHPVLGGGAWLDDHKGSVEVVLGIGEPRIRRRLARRLEADGHRFGTLIHPSAHASRTVEFGTGCVVMAGCSFTVMVSVGSHVVFNPGCTVAHDVRVDDYVYLSPGVDLAGAVHIEEGAFLGTGAVVIPHRTVGRGAVVGAGAVVARDAAPDTVVIGVPARFHRDVDEPWTTGENHPR